MRYLYLVILGLMLNTACSKTDAPEANIHAPSGVPANASIKLKDGSYCFSKLYNRDVTDVQLTILGSAVTGKMNRLPH